MVALFLLQVLMSVPAVSGFRSGNVRSSRTSKSVTFIQVSTQAPGPGSDKSGDPKSMPKYALKHFRQRLCFP